MHSKAFVCALAAGALGVGVAACGASTAPGVVLAPSGGATVATSTAAAATTPTTTTPTATATTPTTGALSKQPVFSVPTGAPPKTLQTKDLIVGTGTTAKDGDELTVNYVGKIYKTGKVFSSSWSSNQVFGPFQLGAGAVIPGWDKGLVGMKVGGRRELILPPSLAYGSKGSSGIPGNSTLVFVVDLLAVSK
jgi:peptidylprolyl isomerase